MPTQSDKWTILAGIISMGHLPKALVGINAEACHKAYVNAPSRTYADFVNAWGLQRGDQVTFVTVQNARVSMRWAIPASCSIPATPTAAVLL